MLVIVGWDAPICYIGPLPCIDRCHDIYSVICNTVNDSQTNKQNTLRCKRKCTGCNIAFQASSLRWAIWLPCSIQVKSCAVLMRTDMILKIWKQFLAVVAGKALQVQHNGHMDNLAKTWTTCIAEICSEVRRITVLLAVYQNIKVSDEFLTLCFPTLPDSESPSCPAQPTCSLQHHP